MRSSHPGGRFTVESEIDRYWVGISEDLQRPVGGEIAWWRFDAAATVVDPIYDTGSDQGMGRRWKQPVGVKYIVAQVFQGNTMQSDRGFYNTDSLRLTLSVHDMFVAFPSLATQDLDPDDLLKDRVIFNGKVFRPSRYYQKGRVLDRYTIITMDLVQVMPEELVNDSQFQSYTG